MISAHFDLPPEEQVVELARHLEEVNPDVAGLSADIEQQLSSAETPEALQAALTNGVGRLIDNSAAYFKNKEQEVTAPFYALAKLCHTVEPDHSTPFLVKLAQVVAAATDKPQARAKVIVAVFNILDVADPKRYDVYLLLVQFCGKVGLTGAIMGQIDSQLDDWLREWGADAEQTRTLYKTIADSCRQCGLTEQSKKYTRLFLKSLNGVDAALMAQHKPDAQTCVIEAIADKDTYQFDDLLELDTVKVLAGDPVHKLLLIFISGDVKAFNEFRASEPTFFEAHQLDAEKCLRKMRLLTLVSLATDTAEVAYSDVQDALEIGDKEVEIWIIDAIRGDLVDARMDQLNQKMIVRKAMRRTFGMEDWQRLGERLNEWTASVTEMLESMAKVRDQAMYNKRQ